MVIDIPLSWFDRLLQDLRLMGIVVHYADPMALYIGFSWGTADPDSETAVREAVGAYEFSVHTLQVAIDHLDRMVLILTDLLPQRWFVVREGTIQYRQMAASKEELLSELHHDRPHCRVTLENIEESNAPSR